MYSKIKACINNKTKCNNNSSILDIKERDLDEASSFKIIFMLILLHLI